MIPVEFRPIVSWPGAMTPDSARSYSRFKASYSATLDLLDRELDHLRARHVVIEVALQSGQIRADGWPKANARSPEHPGVVVSFESKHGPLRYATDQFRGPGSYGFLPGWQANLRAIALGLESLRQVDRYGITKRGEQYTGWSALPPGTIAAGAATMTVEQAARFILSSTASDGRARNAETRDVIVDPAARDRAYRRAAKKLHPDAGGDPELFKRLAEAKRILDGMQP